MKSLIQSDPVGLPGLAAFAGGVLLFFLALAAARYRATRAGSVADARSNRASWIWIGVQGVGIAIAGAGRIDASLDPLSSRAIAEGAVVLMLMIAVVALFHASSRRMGKNWSLVARTREDHELVQSGPFAVVRHPIYVALFLFLIAMAIAYGHTRQLFLAVPVYAAATWMRVRHEERLLRAQFGTDYDAYARRVKRFVPGLF